MCKPPCHTDAASDNYCPPTDSCIIYTFQEPKIPQCSRPACYLWPQNSRIRFRGTSHHAHVGYTHLLQLPWWQIKACHPQCLSIADSGFYAGGEQIELRQANKTIGSACLAFQVKQGNPFLSCCVQPRHKADKTSSMRCMLLRRSCHPRLVLSRVPVHDHGFEIGLRLVALSLTQAAKTRSACRRNHDSCQD